MGPNTVSRLRTTATGPPTVCRGVMGVVAGALVAEVMVTRPSFRWSSAGGTSEGTRVRGCVAGPVHPGHGRTPLGPAAGPPPHRRQAGSAILTPSWSRPDRSD